MYRVAICDDEVAITSEIESRIMAYSSMSAIKTEVDIFYSGKTLLRALRNGYRYDMIFLDIEMEAVSGIQVATYIREEQKNETVQIVFISAKEQYALSLFEVRPLHFLVKPIVTEKIDQVLAKGYELSNILSQYYYYQQGYSRRRQSIKEILYFESVDRQIRMITTTETIQYYGTLTEVYDTLKEVGFVYIHKSYIVNYNYIMQFQYSQVKMQNGAILPISQGRRKEFRELQLELERRVL